MIYLFNNNEEMIRIIPNSAIKRMYQTQTLTDENYISDRLDVEIQALNDEELSELEYMAIDDIENPQRFHYYFIVKETTEHQVTSLTGVQSGIEELRKTPVYDMRPTNLSPKLIADRLLEGTNWQAGYTTDDVGTISTNFYYTDVFSALKKMCVAFGIEMQFFVEITTNRIGARYIEFRKRTGKSVGKRVVYGHNALKIVKEVEKTNTVTALIGRGKGVQVSESDEGNIGYGRKIGIENVEWKTSSGAPVDKPLGQEFVEIPDLTLQYGIKNSNGTVRPKIGFVEFQDEESETRLIDRTYNALLELSRPQVLLETSSVYLPDTGIGDTINVVRHDRDLRYQTRVFEITWDRLANQAVDMKLGDRLGESENKRISNISNQISGNISTELGSTIDELVDRVTTADGKNTNWYTDYDPMENPETMGLVRVNDNWYQPDPEYEGEFILKQWNGEMWVEILRTSGNPELVRRFEEIEQQAGELASSIEATEQKASEAKEEAGLAKSASEALEIITQETASQLSDTRGLLATVESNASEARAKADSAVTQAGQAVSNAQTAMGNAQSALSKASDAESTVNTLSKEVDAVAGEVKLKAEQTEVDTLSGTVSTHTTTLTQHATALSSKAEQSEVDTVKGTVATHTSTLSQQAKEISARLTQSQVDNLVSDKGYSTVSYVDTEISATAGTIRSEMTAVEGKIPTAIGGRNLILNSDNLTFNTLTGTSEKLTQYLGVSNVTKIVNPVWSMHTSPAEKTSELLLVGHTYTLSALFTYSGTKGQANQLHLSEQAGGYVSVKGDIEEGKFNRVYITVTASATATPRIHMNFSGYEEIYLSKWKLEKGDVATDWSPAPEDTMMQNDFDVFKAEYEQSAKGWSAKLLQIEQADYATKSWSNQTFATSQSVTTQLSSYAKTEALNGMVTETILANKNFATASSVSTQLQSYAKTTDLNGLATETYVGSQLSATAGVIRSEITAVENKIPTAIGGRNLLRGTADFDTYFWRNVSTAFPSTFDSRYKQVRVDGDYTVAPITTMSVQGWNFEVGQEYVISVWAKSEALGNKLGVTAQSTAYFEPQVVTLSKWTRYIWKFTATISSLTNFRFETRNGERVWITQPQIEKGSIPTDWTPAPEDIATTKQVSEIKQTADAVQLLVGTTNESVARAVMTSNLWETEVSKVIDSELEQQYETVLSPVHVLNETEHNSGETFSLGKYFNYSGLTRDVPTYLQTKVKHVLEITMPATQNKGQFVYVQTKNLEGKWVNIGAQFNLPTGQYKIVHNFTSTVFATSTSDYRLVLENGGNPPVTTIYSMKIYRNDEVQVPINGTKTGAISTKITQLYDMINLSVLGKEGALSRIAMGEEGIRLKSDLIHLDGKVKMTEAFAQKLFAEEVSADTVTAFSAKFANAIVGNLDVNNIGGNKASFIQLLLNGTNTALRATSSVVDIMRNDGSISTRLTQNGMEIWRDGSKVGDFESRSSISESGALANKKSISMTPERDSYISLGYFKAGETTSTRVLSVAGDTGRLYLSSPIYPSESSTYGLQIQRFTLNSSGGIRVGSTGGSSGIFFGDFGHVSVQFNGTWYSMDRLIN